MWELDSVLLPGRGRKLREAGELGSWGLVGELPLLYQPFGSSQTHDSGTDYSNNKATIAVVSFVVLQRSQRSQWSLDNSVSPDINNGVLSLSKIP